MQGAGSNFPTLLRTCHPGNSHAPPPTLSNLHHKTGLNAFRNDSGQSKCCTCFITRETQKLSKNEVMGARQARGLQCTVSRRQQGLSVKATRPRAEREEEKGTLRTCRTLVTNRWLNTKERDTERTSSKTQA